MTLNRPLLRRLLHRVLARGHVDLPRLASREWVLCPAETARTAPALHPAGALDRVTAISPWEDRARVEAAVRGGPGDHAATRAFEIEAVELAGAWLYKGPAKDLRGQGPARLFDPSLGPRRDVGTAHLVSCFAGSHYFGNFISDALTLELLPEAPQERVVMRTKAYVHEPGYRALLGLPRPRQLDHARIGRLTLYEDFAQNSSKARRYRALRARLRAALGDGPAAGPLVYLKRGATGEPRRVLNEAALEAMLAGMGFVTVEPAALEPDEIARRSLGARLVVSVEGSHISHVLYSLADDGALLVLQPPDRMAMHYKALTDCLGQRFGFVVGLPGAGGFTVDLPELAAMVERMA
ncbi:MAG TPA: glycosyltransferase 61 family protein [Paracoccaceae bacterium]|nr:glycosyltransferase 61 family protein [Paracoccaceae bacterium]HMO70072.1 glycosyltransferase 61 family protein [Paracoccaceae bacterium]